MFNKEDLKLIMLGLNARKEVIEKMISLLTESDDEALADKYKNDLEEICNLIEKVEVKI